MDYCTQEILSKFDFIFDFTRNSKYKDSCADSMGNDAELEEAYRNQSVVGFPTLQYSDSDSKNDHNIQRTVLNEMIAITSREEIEKKQIEIVLNRTQYDHPFIEINVFQNKKLVQRSVENEEKQVNKPITRNILTIFIDTLSRVHYHRKMKQTIQFLEQFYENKQSSHELYQFLRYHTSGNITSSSLIPVYYGYGDWTYSGMEPPSKEIIPLLREFVNQGYITGLGRNFCAAEHFAYFQDDYRNLPINRYNFDHWNVPLFCDPTFYPLSGGLGFFVGAYSSLRRCLYGKDTAEYNFEYGEKFWKAYPDRPKYLELDFLDSHEPTGEVVKYLDPHVKNFMEKMLNSGQLNDTAIIIYSDHGLHYSSSIQNDISQNNELKLPLLNILLPRSVADSDVGRLLKENEQRLVGSYDIHNIFIALMGSNKFTANGLNIFSELVPERQDLQ